jgi:hypothetical protein
MGNRLLLLLMGCALACSLSALAACHSARVIVGSEPTYRNEPPPPPPRTPGPPPWAPAHGYRAKHQYRYYPSSYVYYDTGRRIYFYYSSGKWEASISLPASIRIDLNEYVTLEMDTSQPYQYHPDVVRRHPPGLQKTGPGKGRGR